MKVYKIKSTLIKTVKESTIQIVDSKVSADTFRSQYKRDGNDLNIQEHFYLLMLDNSCNIKGIALISTGGTTMTVVDTKIIFKHAIDNLAEGIILCHNHPSGSLMPSRQDIKVTKKIIEGGKLLDINVFDHIIITEDSYFSFSDEGLI